MARNFLSASQQYLQQTNGSPVISAPFTVNCWARSNSIADNQCAVWIGDYTDNDQFWFLQMQGGIAGDFIRFGAKDSGAAAANAITTLGYSVQTWHMLTGVEAASNSRLCYLDGGNQGTNNTTRSPANTQSIAVARQGDGTPAAYFSGQIARVTIFNDALGAQDIAALYNGGIAIDPRSIRPDLAVLHYELFEDDGDIDWIGTGAYDLQDFNGPDHAEHVPFIASYPTIFPVVGEPPAAELAFDSSSSVATQGDADVTAQLAADTSSSVATAGDADVTSELAADTSSTVGTTGDADVVADLDAAFDSSSSVATTGDADVTAELGLDSSSTVGTQGDADVAGLELVLDSSSSVATLGDADVTSELSADSSSTVATLGDIPVGPVVGGIDIPESRLCRVKQRSRECKRIRR